MSTLITCPSCKHEFAPEDAIARVLEKEYQQKFEHDRQKLAMQFAAQAKELEQKMLDFEKRRKERINSSWSA